jgi:hypothetical protein
VNLHKRKTDFIPTAIDSKSKSAIDGAISRYLEGVEATKKNTKTPKNESKARFLTIVAATLAAGSKAYNGGGQPHYAYAYLDEAEKFYEEALKRV